MARKTWAALLAQFADNDVGAIDAVHIRDLVDSLSAHLEARPPVHTDNQTAGFDVGHTWIDTSASPWPQAWRCVASDTVTGVWARIEGPPGAQGAPGFIPMGAWDDETTYPATAMVRHSGATWIATTEATGVEPGVDTEWNLFLQDGPPGGSAARSTGQYVTGTLDVEDAEVGTVELSRSFDLYAITLSDAAWVVLYQRAADEEADEDRQMDEDPDAGKGIIAEVHLDAPGTQRFSPVPRGVNLEASPTEDITIKVVNKSGSTTAITVDFLFLEVE